MPIVGGLDIHRKQITFDYLDTGTGQVRRGQIAPADRAHLRPGWRGSPAARMSRSRSRGAPGRRYVARGGSLRGATAHLAEAGRRRLCPRPQKARQD